MPDGHGVHPSGGIIVQPWPPTVGRGLSPGGHAVCYHNIIIIDLAVLNCYHIPKD